MRAAPRNSCAPRTEKVFATQCRKVERPLRPIASHTTPDVNRHAIISTNQSLNWRARLPIRRIFRTNAGYPPPS